MAGAPAPARELGRSPRRHGAERSSAIYEGRVHHRRRSPIEHAFTYRIFMPLFDLEELPELLDPIPLWSARRAAPARFRRSDHLGGGAIALADAAREHVEAERGSAPGGPVRLLANPRYLGVGMNPVAFYYLHGDGPGEPVEAIIAEVTNTPWGQRRTYVLTPEHGALEGEFDKSLHVSPFMPMEQRYLWRANEPGERLRFSLTNVEDGERVFEAGVDLRRREITRARMAGLLLRYPPMTLATLARIYANALVLKAKGAPYFRNPRRRDGREPR